MTNTHTLTHPDLPVTLPHGAAAVRRLRNADWIPALTILAALLRQLAVGLGQDTLSEDDVRTQMPLHLMECWEVGFAHDELVAFLGYVSEGIDADADWLEMEDWEALWIAIYEANRRPFGLSLMRLNHSGAFAQVNAQVRAMLTAHAQTLTSSPDATAPDSTPADPISS